MISKFGSIPLQQIFSPAHDRSGKEMTKEQKEKFQALAREIAEGSIVTKALARLIEQILEAIVEQQEPKP